MKYSNAVDPATLRSVIHKGDNKTTNHFISEAIHQRQRDEYDRGVLDVCRDPLLGSTNIVSEGDDNEVSVADKDNNSN